MKVNEDLARDSMVSLLAMLPCRPRTNLLLLATPALDLVIPRLDIPKEVFRLLYQLPTFIRLLIMIFLWEPSYKYTPKWLQHPPDRLWRFIISPVIKFMHKALKIIQYKIKQMPASQCIKVPWSRCNQLSSHSWMLFTLRLRRKHQRRICFEFTCKLYFIHDNILW